MNGLLIDGFYCPKNVQDNILDKIVSSLFENGKITKHSILYFERKTQPIWHRDILSWHVRYGKLGHDS